MSSEGSSESTQSTEDYAGQVQGSERVHQQRDPSMDELSANKIYTDFSTEKEPERCSGIAFACVRILARRMNVKLDAKIDAISNDYMENADFLSEE